MGLFENMNAEPVQNLSLREPVLAKRDQSTREVVKHMRERNLGCAILVDDDHHPVGMFTERMLTQIVATNPAALNQPVGSHAATPWPQVALTDPIVSVLEALELKNVRFLCVVDENGRVAGLTGQKGLMEYVAEHFPGEVLVQRVGQRPYMHKREGA